MSFRDVLDRHLAELPIATLLIGEEAHYHARRVLQLGPEWEPWWWLPTTYALGATEGERITAAADEFGGWRASRLMRHRSETERDREIASPTWQDWFAEVKSGHRELELAETLRQAVTKTPAAVHLRLVIADPLATLVTLLFDVDGEDAKRGIPKWLPEKVYSLAHRSMDRLDLFPSVQVILAASAVRDRDQEEARLEACDWYESTMRGLGRSIPQVDVRWKEMRFTDDGRLDEPAGVFAHPVPRHWATLRSTRLAFHDEGSKDLAESWPIAPIEELRSEAEKESTGAGGTKATDDVLVKAVVAVSRLPLPGLVVDAREASFAQPVLARGLLEGHLRLRHWTERPLRINFGTLTLISADNAAGKTTMFESLHCADHGLTRARFDLDGRTLTGRVCILSAVDRSTASGPDLGAKATLGACRLAGLFGTDVDVSRLQLGELDLMSLLANDVPSRPLVALAAAMVRASAAADAVRLREHQQDRSDWEAWVALMATALWDGGGVVPTGWLREVVLPQILRKLGEVEEGWFPTTVESEAARRQQTALRQPRSAAAAAALQAQLRAVRQAFEQNGTALPPKLLVQAGGWAIEPGEIFKWYTDRDLADIETAMQRDVSFRPHLLVLGQHLLSQWREAVYEALRTRITTEFSDALKPVRLTLQEFFALTGCQREARQNTATVVQSGHVERLARTLVMNPYLWRPLMVDDVTLGHDPATAARSALKMATLGRVGTALLWCKWYADGEARTVDAVATSWARDENAEAAPGALAGSGRHAAAAMPLPQQAQVALTSYQFGALQVVAGHLGAVVTSALRTDLETLIPDEWRSSLAAEVRRAREEYLAFRTDQLNRAGLTVESNELPTTPDRRVAPRRFDRVPAAAIRLFWGACELKPLEGEAVDRWVEKAESTLNRLGLTRLRVAISRQLAADESNRHGSETTSTSSAFAVNRPDATARAIVQWLLANDLLTVAARDGSAYAHESSLSVLYLPLTGGPVPSVGPTRVLRLGAFSQQPAPGAATFFRGEPVPKMAELEISPRSRRVRDGQEAWQQVASAADESNADASKADESKADESKADESKADESKADESKADESKADESKADESKADESSPDAPQPDVPQPDLPQPDIPQPNVPQPDVPQPDAPRPDVPKPDVPKPAAPRPDAPRPPKSTTPPAPQAPPLPSATTITSPRLPPPGMLASIVTSTSEIPAVVDQLIASGSREFTIGLGTRHAVLLEQVDARQNLRFTVPPADGPQGHLLTQQQWPIELIGKLRRLDDEARGRVPSLRLVAYLELSLGVHVGCIFNHLRPYQLRINTRDAFWSLDRSAESRRQADEVDLVNSVATPLQPWEEPAEGADLDVLISITNSTEAGWRLWNSQQRQAGEQRRSHSVEIQPKDGFNRDGIRDGAHAVALADASLRAIVRSRPRPEVPIRLFVSAPLPFAVALGRGLYGIGEVILMEFDNRTGQYYEVTRFRA